MTDRLVIPFPRLHGALVLLLWGCSPSARGPETTADSATTVPAAATIDSTARPVVITLRRDSLGLDASATTQRTTEAIQAVLPQLRAVADFEVLAISPAVLALNVRPRPPARPADLVAALRGHRLVASVEIAGVDRVP